MPEISHTLPPHWHDPILTAGQAKALLARPNHILLIQGGGHLLAHLPPAMPADIITLFVPENRRRQGHARALMAALLEAAKQAHCTALTLEVAADNAAATALYATLGLRQTATRANYYGPGKHALVLTLPL